LVRKISKGGFISTRSGWKTLVLGHFEIYPEHVWALCWFTELCILVYCLFRNGKGALMCSFACVFLEMGRRN